MKYERFTRRDEFGVIALCNACKRKGTEMCYAEESEGVCCFNEGLERLAELEDDIESGKIVRVPCKVGDTVWVITECYNSIKGKNNYFINKRKVEAIEFNERCFLLLCNDGGHYILGRRTFLAREEAEAKLKELQNA